MDLIPDGDSQDEIEQEDKKEKRKRRYKRLWEKCTYKHPTLDQELAPNCSRLSQLRTRIDSSRSTGTLFRLIRMLIEEMVFLKSNNCTKSLLMLMPALRELFANHRIQSTIPREQFPSFSIFKKWREKKIKSDLYRKKKEKCATKQETPRKRHQPRENLTGTQLIRAKFPIWAQLRPHGSFCHLPKRSN